MGGGGGGVVRDGQCKGEASFLCVPPTYHIDETWCVCVCV